MARIKALSKQAAALLNDFQEKAAAYGEVGWRDEEKTAMLKARYRLEKYLLRCGTAARAGVRRAKRRAKIAEARRAE